MNKITINKNEISLKRELFFICYRGTIENQLPFDEYTEIIREMIEYVTSKGVKSDRIIIITPPILKADKALL